MPICYVETPHDLKLSVCRFEEMVIAAEDTKDAVTGEIVRLMPRQNLWVATPDDDGGFKVAPSKWAGHRDLDLELYLKHLRAPLGSVERIDGAEADRRIANLGGIDIQVAGSDHPAARAVRELCGRFGKTAKAGARVRVFDAAKLAPKDAEGPSFETAEFDIRRPSVDVRPLNLAEAKQGLALQFGCKPSDIQIIIRA